VTRYAVGLPDIREYADPRLLVELAGEAEGAGWDGLFLWDHLAAPDSEPLATPVADPWVAIAAIASRTERLRLGIMVVVLARRRPWKVAREAATMDHLCGGRFALGAGLGSAERAEFEAFAEDADRRARADRLDEGLEIIDGLWSGAPYRFEGAHYRVGEAEFVPRPVQRPRIPIWIAGRWPARRPFRRAARWDGVFPTFEGVGHAEMPAPERFRDAVRYTLSRRDGDGPFDVVLEGQTGGRDRRADAAVVERFVEHGLTWWVEKLGWFRGTVDEVRDRIRRGPPGG
jgi:alkanesulfonate monooxygenase SsuD/methylene tetrahydromethanopterin reductase-like flavin-dependent oxidoreductase (luciferase family)